MIIDVESDQKEEDIELNINLRRPGDSCMSYRKQSSDEEIKVDVYDAMMKSIPNP